jgi:2-polyprenyl-3-methyl-5-hydroxy-6-metoxy-1,4-benzoquinol methylase
MSAVRDSEVEPTKGSVWSRFIDANKRFCRRHLEPGLYAVTHMTALDVWYSRRTPAGGTLLEFGCGRTMRLTHLVGARFSERFATDIESVRPSEVPAGVEFRQCRTDALPFADRQFDVVVIRSVLEHLDEPLVTFRELARVIKPGGCVLVNVPNKWDYVSVLAMLSGQFKSSILKHVVRTQWEDFPVCYRCNTRRTLTRVATDAGFDLEEFRPMPSQPGYLSFFVPLYIAGAIYQFAIGLFGLNLLQPAFVVFLRKQEKADRG